MSGIPQDSSQIPRNLGRVLSQNDVQVPPSFLLLCDLASNARKNVLVPAWRKNPRRHSKTLPNSPFERPGTQKSL
ncbi:unnamed protein product [Prunus armeniaca]|uniref:Uncharacterized protein n=1 Tax=Prunus armeniaca TaxID=36596 RepID=A0A6J5XMF9_PRUAR|nr:unnamed protein product [Prunus armeniaca]